MAAGRPRATIASLKLHGIENASSNHKTYANPDVEKYIITEVPPCPTHYSARTKRIWKEIYTGLIYMRVLTTHDLAVLQTGFDSFEEMVQAQKKIKEFDKEHDGSWNESLIKSRKTLSSWMLTSMAEANKVFARYGLTPTERSRLNLIPEEGKKEDPLDVVLGK